MITLFLLSVDEIDREKGKTKAGDRRSPAFIIYVTSMVVLVVCKDSRKSKLR